MGLFGLVVLLIASAGSGSGSTGKCDLYAAPKGSDSATGTSTSPFRSPQKLADSLKSGQTGCLRQGVYSATSSTAGYQELKVTKAGITLASAPGEVAQINGRIYITQGADDVTFENLVLDGTNSKASPSPTVDSTNATFLHDEVTNEHTGICFALGSEAFGEARSTTIEASTVHDCGDASSNLEHGIYVADARATTIRGNWIYGNGSRGIQLYPDAQSTLITGNVIYGNGEGLIFSGDEEVAANNTTVTHNVIAEAQIRRNIESYYAAESPVGTKNTVRENCIYGASTDYYAGADDSGIQQPTVGFTASNNVIAEPSFVDPEAGDFRMTGEGKCAEQLTPPADGLLPGPVVAKAEDPGEPEPEAPGEPEPEPPSEPEAPGEPEGEAPGEHESTSPEGSGEPEGGKPEGGGETEGGEPEGGGEAPSTGPGRGGEAGGEAQAGTASVVPQAQSAAPGVVAAAASPVDGGLQRAPKVVVQSARLHQAKFEISGRMPAKAPCRRVTAFAASSDSRRHRSLATSVDCAGGSFKLTGRLPKTKKGVGIRLRIGRVAVSSIVKLHRR